MNYRLPKKENWTGRETSHKVPPQYWYQNINLTSIEGIEASAFETDPGIHIGLLGYACDEGVRRNQGRVGASNTPGLLKQRLSKLAYHHDNVIVHDFGDIICENLELEQIQNKFSETISALIEKKIVPVAIGGGHDIAFGHFMGIWDAVKSSTTKKIGIINFDAHFDLRPLKDKGNSGTPFYQILSEYSEHVEYLPIGIQKPSNTNELFEIAHDYQVDYILSEQCNHLHIQEIKNKLEGFMERNEIIYVTIDMDGFSSAYAPGVSAPSPMGFSPSFVFPLLQFISQSGKVISYDIAEINPEYDIDNATLNLGARLVDFIVSNYST